MEKNIRLTFIKARIAFSVATTSRPVANMNSAAVKQTIHNTDNNIQYLRYMIIIISILKFN